MVKRLNLPYQALSVEKLEFASQLKLSIFEVENMKLIKRITLVLNNNKII
jgi:peroxiredoxin